MVPTVRGKSGKVWEFYNPKAGGNEILRESRGKSKYQGAKVNRCRKKFELFYTDCIQQLKKNFLFISLADYLYLHFTICLATFVSSAIASD